MSKNSPLDCPICYLPYNFTDKSPLLCPCGHSLCQFCVSNLIKNPILSLDCPICKHKKTHFKFLQLSDFPKNFELIKMMEKVSNSDEKENKCCPDHISPFEYICLTCKSEICAKCLSYTHRNHEFELIGDFYSDVEFKAMLVKKEVDKVEAYLDKIDQEITNTENKLYENISTCFEGWTIKLQNKENEIRTQVNTIFNGKRRYALFANEPDTLLINWAKKYKPILENYEKNKSLKESVELKLENPNKLSAAFDELISKDPSNIVASNIKKLSFIADKRFDNAIGSCSKLLISDESVMEEKSTEMSSKFVQCSSLSSTNAVIYHALRFYQVKSSGNETRISIRDQSLIEIETQIDSVFMNPESTTELVLELGAIKFEDKNLDPLLNLIWKFKFASKVNLIIQNGSYNKTNIKRLFSGGLQIFTGLKSLQIDLRKSILLQERDTQKEVEGSFIETLCSAIEEFEELNHLSLKFDFMDKIFRESKQAADKKERIGTYLMSSLSKNVQSLHRLMSLELSFEGFQFNEEKLKYLGTFLAKLENLKSLNLNLSNLEKVNDKGLQELFKAMFPLKLQELKLYINNLKEITDNTLRDIFKLIERQRDMLAIHLSFNNCPMVSNTSLYNMADLISRNTKFQTIDISFDNCKSIQNKGFAELSKALQKLKSLKTLRIKCGNNENINWKGGFACLYETLSKLQQLESFTLETPKLKEMNDYCFVNMFDCSDKNPSLKSIKLNLSQNPLITDAGIEMLITSIDCLESLQYVEINLDGCSKLTIKSLLNILNSFSVLKNLNGLNISFAGVKDNFNQLDTIHRVLSTYQSLKNLNLIIPDCENYNSRIKDKLKGSLEHKMVVE